jgi:hypothetical protein
VHDPSQSPERNHLLCLGADRSLSHYAPEPQALVTAVTRHGGIGFIAHPIERAAPLYNEPALPWTHWDVSGFAGIELWNYMSEFKAHLWSKSAAIFAAFFPGMVISGPFPEALALWDNLLRDGRKIVAIGNADAHANVYRLGPLQRAVFAYEHLFKAVNTHLLLSAPLSTDVASAKAQVLNALWAGHAFVAYDLIGSSKGFRFTATTGRHSAWMGDEIHLDGGPISLHVTSPLTATLRLLKDGRLVAKKRGKELTFQANTAGVYRVEAYRSYWFKLRGWIFANPIYVRD